MVLRRTPSDQSWTGCKINQSGMKTRQSHHALARAFSSVDFEKYQPLALSMFV